MGENISNFLMKNIYQKYTKNKPGNRTWTIHKLCTLHCTDVHNKNHVHYTTVYKKWNTDENVDENIDPDRHPAQISWRMVVGRHDLYRDELGCTTFPG